MSGRDTAFKLPRELEVASPGGLDLLACGLEVVRLRGWQGHHTGRGLLRQLGQRDGHHELREEFRLPIQTFQRHAPAA